MKQLVAQPSLISSPLLLLHMLLTFALLHMLHSGQALATTPAPPAKPIRTAVRPRAGKAPAPAPASAPAPPRVPLELRRLFDRGQVVAVFQQHQPLAHRLIQSIPDADLLRSCVSHKAEKARSAGSDLALAICFACAMDNLSSHRGSLGLWPLIPLVEVGPRCATSGAAWTVT